MGGPHAPRRSVLQDEAGDLARHIQVRHQLTLGVIESEGRQPVAVARHHVDQIGGMAVDHQWLQAIEQPLITAPSRRGGDALEGVAGAGLLHRHRGALRTVGEMGEQEGVG